MTFLHAGAGVNRGARFFQSAIAMNITMEQHSGVLMRDNIRQTPEFFARPDLACDSAEQVAEAAVSTWRDINGVLSPVIGPQGFSALYKRALYIVCADYPWLISVYEGTRSPTDFLVLRTILLQQTIQGAIAASSALLQTFYDILGSLIGARLAEQLLSTILKKSSSVHSVQDSPHEQSND